jgi:sigma-B regulation protein RsbU (phosphoserine phosphatase)
VQLALMPERSPVVPGWALWLFTRPANDVGGDLVDSIGLKDGKLGLVLGDVSGKGLGAALLMAKLQATLRAFATEVGSLADLGAHVNRILCRDGLPGRFATLVFLELDPGSGKVKLLNAGHMPPYIVRGEGYESLPSVAPVVGILSEASYVEQSLELASSQLLLVYSDGLTEAVNSKDEFFGEERLQALLAGLGGLSAKAAGERLLTEVARFVGEERFTDDLSLVVIKRGDSSAAGA